MPFYLQQTEALSTVKECTPTDVTDACWSQAKKCQLSAFVNVCGMPRKLFENIYNTYDEIMSRVADAVPQGAWNYIVGCFVFIQVG